MSEILIIKTHARQWGACPVGCTEQAYSLWKGDTFQGLFSAQSIHFAYHHHSKSIRLTIFQKFNNFMSSSSSQRVRKLALSSDEGRNRKLGWLLFVLSLFLKTLN